MIIIHHRAQSLVSLGAVVVVLLLAFDPFIQQILTYPVHSTAGLDVMAKALAPQLREYIPSEDQHEWASALSRGFYSKIHPAEVASPQCSSGNCTRDPYFSVGLCSSCADMTTATTFDCDFLA